MAATGVVFDSLTKSIYTNGVIGLLGYSGLFNSLTLSYESPKVAILLVSDGSSLITYSITSLATLSLGVT